MEDKQNIAPNLYLMVNYLEDNCVEIATNWVKVTSVNAIFTRRKISKKKFRDSFSVPIIEYFIAVIREEQLLGDCPVMRKFVNFMIVKGITPQEIFDICMGFRRSLIAFLLKDEVVQKNAAVFMDETSIIFDANLSGVLKIFTNLYSDTKKKLEIAKSQQEKLSETLKIINSINTKIIIIQNNRIILANEPFLEMIGVVNLKDLYSKYKGGFDFLTEVDLFSNEFNINMPRWIRKICKNNKPFQSRIYNEKLEKKFNYSGRITEMPGEETDHYIITLNNISEHIKDEKLLQDSLEHDELTGFRNYPTFEIFLSTMLSHAKNNRSRLFLAVVDIPNLVYIYDTYGKDTGDLVIAEVAESLRLLAGKNIYLGKLDGSRFGILMEYQTEQDSYNWCIKLFHKMKENKVKKTLAITEIDLSESINKLFLRVYDLIEELNNTEDTFVMHDFKNIIENIELQDQKEFTDRLSHIKSLNMCIFYMELPIASEVNLISTSADSIKIMLSSKQIKIVKIDMPIYFRLENIGNIKAIIKEIDIEQKIATINTFRTDKHTPLNRELYRVAATENIKAYISDNNREYDVEILDMNVEYIAIKIDRKRNFDINSLIYLDMLLPIFDNLNICASNATITRIDKVYGGYKMVLLCHLDTETRDTLSQYISKRQIDIIQYFQADL